MTRVPEDTDAFKDPAELLKRRQAALQAIVDMSSNEEIQEAVTKQTAAASADVCDSITDLLSVKALLQTWSPDKLEGAEDVAVRKEDFKNKMAPMENLLTITKQVGPGSFLPQACSIHSRET